MRGRRLSIYIFGLVALAACDVPPASGFGEAGDTPAPAEEPSRLEWQWRELTGPLDRHVDRVVFSPDGSLVAAGSQDTICVWATATGKIVTRMKLPEVQIFHRLVFSADGKTLISDCREDPVIRFWDAKTGKQLRELPHAEPGVKSPRWTYSSTFRGFGPRGEVYIDDVHVNREWCELQVTDLATGKVRAGVRQNLSSHDSWSQIAFAPDGKTFALNGPLARLRVFETATGKLVKELRPPDQDGRSRSYRSWVAYSPDGRFLIAQEHTGRVETFDVSRFVIWGVADGKRYWERENRGGSISAGNRYLITDAKTVLDLLGDEAVEIGNAPTDDRQLAAMSADGKTLAFLGPVSAPSPTPGGHRRFSIYLTPALVLPPPLRATGGELSVDELDAAWSGVTAANRFRREHCAKVLSAQPEQAVEQARKKLAPVLNIQGERVTDLVKHLNDDDVDVRDKVTSELQQAAHRFEPLLADSLISAKVPEIRNRLTSILKKVTDSVTPVDLAAELRGVAFLEQLNTPAARKRLGEIAAGATGARLSTEAGAALDRLKSR